ncbi:RagB/SusD family nutrient uptake outer membrane protein [Lascolabacillus massiliensis]|jgi:tetratricopeptide (TPR) repeat protein|uniref:RagB/SusD family nutrient uptake outer membrane protein n=1 Tax=Lascolabacillus massiliensis TaxID=1627894 RepID=UPI0006B3ADCB|nr:RagB/SusD family nutrient uptake outer membrane protein [Lascolabacillus massiliensis]TAH60138.1 MAG: RagB/SusD family nutrient uptake outer membrane protein [Fermentimonas caenicola]
MKKITIYSILAAVLLFTACDIDRLPYGSMPDESIKNDPGASLNTLLTGTYSQLKGWSDVMHRCGEYAGDNIMIRGTSTDAFYEFISYSRTPNNYRLQTFWDNSYKVIAQSSNIITMIEEGQSPEIDSQIGEAYFLRGMMYYYLVRAYGRPFAQNPDQNLGVPIVNGTPDDVFGEMADRSTVRETYEQAIADLEKAASLITVNRGSAYASEMAAKALLSRIYLYMSGTYDNPNVQYAELAERYADEVIASGEYELLPREEFMRYNTFTPENNAETIFAIKRVASEFSGYDHYYGIGGMYANIGGMGWGEMYASAEYLALLDETGRNDWANNKLVDARAAFIEPQYTDDGTEVFRFIKDVYNGNGTQTGYGYVQAPISEVNGKLFCTEESTTFEMTPVDEEQGIYSIEYTNGKIYTGVVDKLMRLNRAFPMFYITKCSREGEESHLHSPVISRLGEIYLNKAEAAAKQGDYATALTALNTVRERSLPGEGYTSLNAENASELIDKERRLELAFQAERSYDVFRNGDPLTRKYPGPHNAMEVVEATDYRVVYYIPQDAINAYKGTGSTLTQNPTSN